MRTRKPPEKLENILTLFSNTVQPRKIIDIVLTVEMDIEDVDTEILVKIVKPFDKIDAKWRKGVAVALALNIILIKLINDNGASYLFTGLAAGIAILLTFAISGRALNSYLKNAVVSLDTALTEDEKEKAQTTLQFLQQGWNINSKKDPLGHERQNQQLLIAQVIRNELQRRQQLSLCKAH